MSFDAPRANAELVVRPGAGRLARCGRALRGRPPLGSALGMPRERSVRGRTPRFLLEGLFDGPGYARPTTGFARSVSGFVRVFRASARARPGFAFSRRRK